MKKLYTLIFSLLLTSNALAANTPQYKLTKTFKLPDSNGWDYLAIDPLAHRLYVTRFSHVAVLELSHGNIVADIPNLNGVHGVAIAEKLHRAYLSNGIDGNVVVVDTNSYKELTRISAGKKPDAILYDSKTANIFVMNGGSNDVTVIDPKLNSVIARIELPGQPEFAASDGQGTIFINLEDKNQIAVVDAKAHKLRQVWTLGEGQHPTGLAIDRARRLLFSVCANEKMVVVSYASGKIVATLPIGAGPDAAVFDKGTKTAFSSNGKDGTLTVVGGKGQHLKVLATVKTTETARTMALDPKTHNIYLAAATPDGSAETRPRKYKDGSFEILVFSPSGH